MADSAVAITVGSGTSIDTRTESTNGHHRQVVVLGDPATNAGVAPVDATNGLTVDLGTNNDVTVTGTVTANLSTTDNTVLDSIETATEATQAAVEIIDNAISGSEMQVDVVGALPAGTALLGKVGIDQVTANANEVVVKSITAGDTNIGNVDIASVPAPLNVVNGGAEATALRVTIANDSTGVVSVDDNGGSLTVDNGGTFAVQAASTVADGADVTLGAKADAKSTATDTTAVTAMQVLKEISYMEQNPASRAVTNAGTFAVQSTNQANSGVDIGDVTINNSTGAAAVNIQDGGNTITVDGTVTANLGATDNTVLDTIATNTTKDVGNGAVSTNTQRVTIANDSTGIISLTTSTASIGKLAANSGVDIGDVDVTSITNGSINGPAAPVVDSYTHAAINLNAGANQVLVSSSASHQIWVYGFGFTVNAAGSVSFQDEDDTAITGIMPIATNGGMVVAPSGNFAMPIWKLATDKDLEVDVVTSELDGWIDYAIVNA